MDTQDLAPLTAPPGAIRVRPSTDDDIGAIAAIYGHHVLHGTGSFETEAPGAEEMRRRRADILARGLPYLVAEGGDGAVLGYAYASAYRPRAAYRNTAENSVYVRHDLVGRGVGACCSRRCSPDARRSGCGRWSPWSATAPIWARCGCTRPSASAALAR